MAANLALIIDDDEHEQYAHKRTVARSGKFKNIVCFACALEALEFLADDHQHIDAIFLDINMPRMDGIEFIETATQRFGNNFATVVALLLSIPLSSQYVNRIDASDCVIAQVDKPLSTLDLEAIESDYIKQFR